MPQTRIALIGTSVASHLMFRIPLIKALQAKGAKVSVLASDFDVSTREIICELGADAVDISLSRTGMNPLSDVFDTIRLMRVLRRLKPDIVLSTFVKPVIFGTLAAWFVRIPCRAALIEGLGFVFTDDGETPSVKKLLLRGIVSNLYRVALSKADRVIFLNPDDIRDFERWGIVANEKAFELGGIGVDLEEWKVASSENYPLQFLFIGRLLAEKGVYDFVSAARIVKAHHPTAQFVVLGDVDSNPGGIRKTQILTWVREGLIEWPGHVPVKSWLQRCSVFVLPSYREGVPRSTQEAMAMGRAVITTDTPGCRQTVEDGINGFLVPVRDPSALAKAMCKFIDAPELITEMGGQSRRLAEERFDVHKANQKLLTLLGV